METYCVPGPALSNGDTEMKKDQIPALLELKF